MEIGYFVALVGGILSIFSPCSAMLLPTFFAYTATSKGKLSLMGLAFFVGLLITMVPLGMGVAWVGNILPINQETMLIIAGWVIIGLGVLTILGGGFDFGRLMPWRTKAQTSQSGPIVGSLLLGTVAGVAGFCTGPILGAILTVVMTSPSVLHGGLIMAFYALGLLLPVMILAALWRKISPNLQRKMRGRTFAIGRLKLNTSALIIGAIFIVVGIVMIVTKGFLYAPELVSTETLNAISTWAAGIEASVPNWVLPATVTAGALVVWHFVMRKIMDRPAA